MDCKVCKSPKATKWNYYGATSICNSCRGFFMRSVQSGLYKVFCQDHASICEINSISRKSCKKCRFEKCLEVGMKIAYVKSLEERCKKIIVNQKIEKPKLSEYFEEKYALREYHNKKTQFEVQVLFNYYETKPDLFLHHFCFGVPGSVTDQDLTEWSKFSHFLLKQNYGFVAKLDDVPMEDSLLLFYHNFSKIETLFFMLSFKNYSELQHQYMQVFVSHGNENRSSNPQVNQLMEIFDQFGDVKNTPTLSYDQVYASPWAAHVDIEEEHEKIFNEVMTWLDNIGEVDHCFILILQLILFYNSDGIESRLKEAKKVQQLQSYYAKLLHKYLKSKQEDNLANNLFSKAIMLVYDTQRTFELSLQRLKLE